MRISVRADRDMTRRVTYLTGLRGEIFAQSYARDLVARFARIAELGVQLGTALGDDPRIRTFGHASDATVLARFGPEEFLVMRIYFKGQDWRHGR